MNIHLPSPENDAMHLMRQELLRWSTPFRIRHADAAGAYVAALEGVVNTVMSGAQLVAGTPIGRPGDAEAIAWRIDGDVLDGDFDFATRVSAILGRADERTSAKDYLHAEPIVPLKVSPVVPKELGAKGLYVAGVEYKKVSLKREEGPLITIHAKYAKFARTENGFAQQVYSADHKQVGEVVAFPRMPAYETMESLGYAAFCLSKVHKAPVTHEVARELAVAAAKDAAAPYRPDNLSEYAEKAASVPKSVEDKIRSLGTALYEQQAGQELLPNLITALLDPDTAAAARLAQLNKSKYVRPIAPRSRTFTPVLHSQLAVVADYAARFQGEVYPLMLADRTGYDEAMNAELQKAEAAARDAQAFHVHLSAPETIAPDPSCWVVRGSL